MKDDNGATVTVNSERYIVILEKFWKELQPKCGTGKDSQWFHQDGATPLTANISLQWLKEHFKTTGGEQEM